ncbi:integrase core domain-containing protein [bacterium]|nr:integrase core domain-containing protein [bacterium]
MPVFLAFLGTLPGLLRTRASLQLEVLALRHQLAVLHRNGRRPRLTPADRMLWAWIARRWPGWKDALVIVKPATVVAWQRRRFRRHWRKLVRSGKVGRPAIDPQLRAVIRNMSSANPLWGTPRIQGELAKIGIGLSRSTIDKYRIRPGTPRTPGWRTFLRNHGAELASIDFFAVPTVRFRVLYVFLVLSTDRRRVVHWNVTENPTAEWTARQIVQAFPWDTAPRYLLRDRDAAYGEEFRSKVRLLQIEEVLTSPARPWQNPYVERLIGSIRRECLDHAVILGERHLRHLLRRYFSYYHRSRTHLSLDGDPPEPRPVHAAGRIIALPEVGGLHHRYERWRAEGRPKRAA